MPREEFFEKLAENPLNDRYLHEVVEELSEQDEDYTELTDEELDKLPISAVENGEVVTYPNAQAMLDAQDEAPFIDHFYVVPDLERRGQLEVQTFATFEEAYAAYSEFSTENVKALGVQNTNPLPGSLDLIQCREGKDVLVEDYLQVEGWNNPEISAVVNRIQEALQTQEKSVQETDSQSSTAALPMCTATRQK